MRKSVLFLFTSILIGGSAYAQRWTEVEINTGVTSVLGEMQDMTVGFNALNPAASVSLYTRANKSDRWAFGGTFSYTSMYMAYQGNKNWLMDHETQGHGYSAIIGTRLLLTGRDDMRFMKGAFITYLEAAGGGHIANFKSTYPPMVSPQKTEIDKPTESVFTPIGSATLGFQYYFGYKIGVSLRFSGQVTNTDYLDGIEGITDANDYLLSAMAGVTIGL